MEVIHERLVCLEILIGQEEDGEECSIIDRLKKAVESVDMIVSLYISLAEKSSERLEAAEETISILKQVVTNTPSEVSTSKPNVPKPKSFGRAKSSKELENFLWDMEQYFSVIKIGVAEQVNLIVMYLMGDAKLWWRTRIEEDLSAGHPKIKRAKRTVPSKQHILDCTRGIDKAQT
jgi:hypothetical protein